MIIRLILLIILGRQQLVNETLNSLLALVENMGAKSWWFLRLCDPGLLGGTDIVAVFQQMRGKQKLLGSHFLAPKQISLREKSAAGCQFLHWNSLHLIGYRVAFYPRIDQRDTLQP